jgi:nitrilase
MSTVRIAAIQMNSGGAVRVNLDRARSLLREAAADGAKLAVLPENFAQIGAHESDRAALAEADGEGPLQTFLAREAAHCRMWIVGGSLPLLSGDPARPYAACCVFDDTGRRIGRYDKIHLFDVDLPESDESYRESRNTTAGSHPLLLETPWGKLGIAVCYDLRFPELFRWMCAAGLEILALPAAFTVKTGQAHWRMLVRARAVENLCYVVAAAQTGVHPGGRRTHGHSMIVDPWGEVLVEADEAEGVIGAVMDRARLEKLRRRFPVLEHRRFVAPGAGRPR